MKINISVPNSMHVAAMTQPWEHSLSGSDIASLMAKADELGFNKCMLGEHFIIPRQHIDLSGDHYLHSTVALSFLAASTRYMKLSSSISILPLQNPIVQAKAWSTLDWLSGGRAVALFGVGWLKEEFDMLGVNFHERGQMADEFIAAMIELWTNESPEFEGRYVSFRDIGFAPKPIQMPHVPIWFGGDAEAVMRRVAKFGNGWSPFRTAPEKFPECLDFIRSQPEYNGRPLDIFFALQMLNVGAQHEILDDPRAPGVWEVQKTIDQIHWLSQLGVTETIIPIPKVDGRNAYIERMHWVAEEIISKVDK